MKKTNYEILKEAFKENSYIADFYETCDSFGVYMDFGGNGILAPITFEEEDDYENLQYILNDLYYMFDMNDYVYCLVWALVVNTYIEEIRPYVDDEEVISDIEDIIVESYYNFRPYVPEELFKRIEKEAEDTYNDVLTGFKKFEKELIDKVEELEEENSKTVIDGEYGINWEEVPSLNKEDVSISKFDLLLEGTEREKLFALAVKKLSYGQGFYGRIIRQINEMSDEKFEMLKTQIENSNITSELDVVEMLEC